MDIKDNGTNAAAGLIVGAAYAEHLARVEADIKTYDDGRPYRIAANGALEIVEKLQNQPTWRRGLVNFHDALSFAAFVKRFRNTSSVVFADKIVEPPTFTAILDYQEPGGDQNMGTKWDLFRAVLPLAFTQSWSRWDEADNKEMEQADFALFLEENIPDIAAPDGAKLVEIARTLEAAIGVNWQSAIRADNGERRFSFIETVSGNASTKEGKVDIPAEFTLALAPFEGSKRYEVGARLRYKIIQGRVKLWFVLVRAEDVLDEAFNDELLKIEGELNGATTSPNAETRQDAVYTPVYKGPAPAALTPPSVAGVA